MRVPSKRRSPISNSLFKNRRQQLSNLRKRIASRKNAANNGSRPTAVKPKTNWDFYFADGHLGIGVTSRGNRLSVKIPIGKRPQQQDENGDQGDAGPGEEQGEEQGDEDQGQGGYVNPYSSTGSESPDSTPINIHSNEQQYGPDETQNVGSEEQGDADGGQDGEDDSQTSPGEQFLETALADFQKGRLKDSMKSVEQARKLMPDNTDLHHFRSLVHLASGDYRKAAAAAHKALTGGPGWDWQTLKQMYPDVATYTKHLRALEKHSDDNPKAAEARFLIAYHYLTMGTPGHIDAAKVQLKKAIELEPNDALSAAILKNLEAPQEDEPGDE